MNGIGFPAPARRSYFGLLLAGHAPLSFASPRGRPHCPPSQPRTSGAPPGVGHTLALILLLTVCAFAATSVSAQGRQESVFEAELQSARLTRLIGEHVENPYGERLGTVRDVVLAGPSDGIKYVIISAQGLASVGPRKVVPAGAVSGATTFKDTLALDISKTRWAKAPKFRNNLLALGDPATARAIADFYSPDQRGPAKSPSTNSSPVPPPIRGNSPPASAAASKLRLAGDLLGTEVVSQNKQPLGRLVDLLVDLQGTKPTMAILSTGTLLTRGPEFTVSLRLLHGDGSQLALDATRAQLERSPAFSARGWNEVQDSTTNACFRLTPSHRFK